MNGAKELDQIVNTEGHRISRNATMLAQQMTNDGFANVKAKWTVTFQADAPDGSGRMTKSIVGSADRLVAGNGPRAIGGNGQTGLSSAVANSKGGGKKTAVPVKRTPSAVVAGGSASDGDDDDDSAGDGSGTGLPSAFDN